MDIQVQRGDASNEFHSSHQDERASEEFAVLNAWVAFLSFIDTDDTHTNIGNRTKLDQVFLDLGETNVDQTLRAIKLP